jgi:hypothetical protein
VENITFHYGLLIAGKLGKDQIESFYKNFKKK